MKTLLILVLALGLAAAAFFTKPSQADFTAYIHQQQGADSGLSLKGVINTLEVDNYLKAITFHNNVLWVTVEKDGQRQYVGAFSHWFKSTPPAAQPASATPAS